MAETKFSEFIAAKKLDKRRILAASHRIERLRPEDRIIKLNKRRARAAGDAADKAAKETRKPRSGRPVTPRALDAAVQGTLEGRMEGPGVALQRPAQFVQGHAGQGFPPGRVVQRPARLAVRPDFRLALP